MQSDFMIFKSQKHKKQKFVAFTWQKPSKLPLFGKLPENGKFLSNVTQQRLVPLT